MWKALNYKVLTKITCVPPTCWIKMIMTLIISCVRSTQVFLSWHKFYFRNADQPDLILLWYLPLIGSLRCPTRWLAPHLDIHLPVLCRWGFGRFRSRLASPLAIRPPAPSSPRAYIREENGTIRPPLGQMILLNECVPLRLHHTHSCGPSSERGLGHLDINKSLLISINCVVWYRQWQNKCRQLLGKGDKCFLNIQLANLHKVPSTRGVTKHRNLCPPSTQYHLTHRKNSMQASEGLTSEAIHGLFLSNSATLENFLGYPDSCITSMLINIVLWFELDLKWGVFLLLPKPPSHPTSARVVRWSNKTFRLKEQIPYAGGSRPEPPFLWFSYRDEMRNHRLEGSPLATHRL